MARFARSASIVAARLRGIPAESVLVGIGLFALLGWFAGADPIRGLTFSGTPFSDEGFNLVNARNFVQLGRWSTDDWNLHLVNLPFSAFVAGAFELLGVGIVQARLALIACVSLTAAALAWNLRYSVGRSAALLGALTFSASGLVLFYGRLAFLEDFVGLGLTLGVLVLAREGRLGWRRGIWTGACFALAIGAKPNAAFSAVGILLAVAVARGWRDPACRRWLAGSALTIAAAGLLWAVAIWLPNRTAVGIDLQIWHAYEFTLSPTTLARLVGWYATGNNDHLYSFLLAPALALAAVAVVVIVALRRRLTGTQTRLAVAAFGWAAAGFGTLMIVNYRPNRYVVPLVPALAILAAVGFHLAAGWLRERFAPRRMTGGEPERIAVESEPVGAASPAARPRGRRLIVPGLTVVAFVVATAPGLVWYAGWARSATYDLPAIQDQFARAVPDNTIVAGPDSAIYLLRSRAITVMMGPAAGPANDGDLYAAGVRWYLVPIDAGPPKGVPVDIWATRQQITCGTYGGNTQCLYRLP